jgi:cellulose biosynthesis protein BcsQ
MRNSVIVQWHYTTMIIAIFNEKGGVGKTTLATNLARAFQAEQRSVLLVDSDPRAAFVVTRQITDTPRAAESRTGLQELGVPILNAYTSQRIASAQASSNGRTVIDTEPTGPAANEVRALVHDIQELAHASG